MTVPIDNRLSAVVVHYRSYETIGSTVAALVSSGIRSGNICVVDNSMEPDRRDELLALLHPGVHVLFDENRGYGAACNAGVRFHAERNSTADYVLVATHEVLPDVGAVELLVAALEENPSASVAGPTLVVGESRQIVWSAGGYLTKYLRLPRHTMHGFVRDTVALKPQKCEWVDGAFVLYRAADLLEHPINETYFMYMEEVDLHQRLKRLSKETIWVPQAIVSQSSSGIPDYYLARNMQIYQDLNGTRFSAAFAVPYEIVRRVLSRATKGGAHGDTKDLFSGWISGRRLERAVLPTSVRIVNPVGAMLHHYSAVSRRQLSTVGAACTVMELSEPSHAEYGRLSWLVRTYATLVRARVTKPSSKILFVWPALGALDTVLVRFLGGSASWLVVHDPEPLVRSVGNGKWALWFARRFGTSNLVVHSEVAGDSVFRLTGHAAYFLEHPTYPASDTIGRLGRRQDNRRVIRVFGQYKADRDTELLVQIAQRLGGKYDLEVVGKGWPAVAGWRVSPDFVVESDVDGVLASADVVLIPYRRFYQSGVAIRCLEVGTAVVGPAQSSLVGLLGHGSPLLAGSDGPDDWVRAIEFGMAAEANVIAEAYSDFARRSNDSWSRWLNVGGRR
ncbi:glycosyltransferase family 2 protein [Williamsia sp. D3]|uniref:glycosyltransferase family 2 protein n=1 Tax=Williamsia sp. D3 TaxID=1313067 RepID=UPI000402AD27|nr:glycosyltransferase [Williamsia sp. D3]